MPTKQETIMEDLTFVQRASTAYVNARSRRDATIAQARDLGFTWRAISDASGLSIQGVMKIANRYNSTHEEE